MAIERIEKPVRERQYPELESIESSSLMNREFVIEDAVILAGSLGEFTVAKISVDGKTVSTAFGSKVVTDRIKANLGKFPRTAKLVQKKSKKGAIYFDLE